MGIDALVLAHLGLVKRIAAGIYAERSFDGVPFDDYLQYGAEGLLQAAQRFDPTKGNKFESYASHRIKGAILSGLEQSSEVNRQVATLRRLRAERLQSVANLEAPGATQLDSQRAFERIVEASIHLAIGSMLEDSTLYVAEGRHHWDDGAANLDFKQLQRLVLGSVKQLSDVERAVIDGHYFQHDSFELIADRLHLSKGRVSQLHRQALSKLRTLLSVQRLGELIG